jgi:cytochrome b pre-mRNA-processing protein 3
MRALLASLFGSSPARRKAERLLDAITVQARQPVFFTDFAVPDTLDGRFDLMSLHGALVFRALERKGREGHDLAQLTTDLMFGAFDDAIRSLGVGDSGIPRRVKTMGKAYIGRASAYDAALKAGDAAALGDALARNVYRGATPGAAVVQGLAAYVAGEAARLERLPLERFEAPDLGFSLPEAPLSK